MPCTRSDTVCCTVLVESVRVRVAKRFVGCPGEAVTVNRQVAFGARLEQFDTALNVEGLIPLKTGGFRVRAAVPVFVMAIVVAAEVCPRTT